jgi:hypothetical protein
VKGWNQRSRRLPTLTGGQLVRLGGTKADGDADRTGRPSLSFAGDWMGA